jgi:hypothetical protein
LEGPQADAPFSGQSRVQIGEQYRLRQRGPSVTAAHDACHGVALDQPLEGIDL